MAACFDQVLTEEIRKRLGENVKAVMAEAGKADIVEWLRDKIISESAQTGESFDNIKALVATNALYAKFFAKDPKKQK